MASKARTTRTTRGKQPADRLGKMPRIRRTTVPLDDEAVEALEEAQRNLADATDRIDSMRGRRVAQARIADPTAEQGQLEARVDTADEAELKPLRDAVEKAEKAVRDSSRTFAFRSIGRLAYQELRDRHPPQEQDHEDVKAQGIGQRAAYHAETFAPALIQAASLDPVLTGEDIAEIFDGDAWNESEITQLYMAALEVNTQRRVVELPR